MSDFLIPDMGVLFIHPVINNNDDMPKKKIPQHEQVDAKKDEINERLTRDLGIRECPTQPPPTEIGDIIQIVTKGHKFIARIGIVHHAEDMELVCYQPQKGGVPQKFKVDTRDTIVVGKAHLKYSRPLPDDDVSKTNLDQI